MKSIQIIKSGIVYKTIEEKENVLIYDTEAEILPNWGIYVAVCCISLPTYSIGKAPILWADKKVCERII